MKYKSQKIIIIFLAATMLFLSACGLDLSNLPTRRGTNMVVEPEVTTTPAPAEEIPEVQEHNEPNDFEIVSENRVNVLFNEYREVFTAPDNDEIVILDFSYTEPKVTVFGNETVSEEISELLAISNEQYYSGDEEHYGVAAFYEIALDAYTYAHQTGIGVDYRFFSNKSAKVLRADESVVSILFTESAYIGDLDEIYTVYGMCFSAESGSRIHFYNLGPDAEALNARVIQCLKSDYKLTVDGYSTSAYFAGLSDEGLVFAIENELYTVTYDEVSRVIFPVYIPREYSVSANVILLDFDAGREYSTSIVDNIVIDEEGSDFLLKIVGTALNFKLTEVIYSYDSFYEAGEIWFSNYITDAAVQIKTNVPDGMPNLMLSYEDGEGNVTKLLVSQSGFDGAPILVSDGINAVG